MPFFLKIDMQPFDYDDILEEGTHFVSFGTANLEDLLLEYLENEERLKDMASSASIYLRNQYSYENFLHLLHRSGFSLTLLQRGTRGPE